MRGGDAVVVFLHRLPTLFPHGVIVEVGTPRDARAVPRLVSGSAWRVIASRAVGHDRDSLRVDVRPGGDILVGGCSRYFVVIPGRQPAQPQRFALPGPVD